MTNVFFKTSKHFIKQTLNYSFTFHYITFGIFSLFSTYVTTFEAKVMVDMYNNQATFPKISYLITTLLLLEIIKVYYFSFIRFNSLKKLQLAFFNQISEKKLEYWDQHYSKDELTKIIFNDLQYFISTFLDIYRTILQAGANVCLSIWSLYHIELNYLWLGIGLCVLRSLFLEKIAVKWEDYHNDIVVTKNKLDSIVLEFVNQNQQLQMYYSQNAYLKLVLSQWETLTTKKQTETYFYTFFMFIFSLINKSVDFSLIFVLENETPQNIQYTLLLFKGLTESVQSLTDISKKIKRCKDTVSRIDNYIYNSNNKTNEDINNNLDDPFIDNFAPIICINNLTFQYPKTNNTIFTNFNYTIPFGTKLTIRGISGKGKSTLIKLVMGLYNPTSGDISINKCKTHLLSRNILKCLISIVPQEPIILEGKTLKENISVFVRNGVSVSERKIKKILKSVQLSIPLDQTLINLSGGQKQRLAIARALLNDTPILILDEPFSALDNQLKSDMFNIVCKLKKTILMISHDTQYSFKESLYLE